MLPANASSRGMYESPLAKGLGVYLCMAESPVGRLGRHRKVCSPLNVDSVRVGELEGTLANVITRPQTADSSLQTIHT